MKILIVENEIYLAQSIASKLSEEGHVCDMTSSAKDALKGVPYDVVLLSTGINIQDINPIIEAYKNAVIILMVSYISNDTVSKPLAAGAKDYIIKPFMIEELIRKIEHYQDYERLKHQNTTYKTYLEHNFESIKLEQNFDNLELPILLSSNLQKYSDAFAFAYADHHNKPLHFISLATPKALTEIQKVPASSVVYITDLHLIKKPDREPLRELIMARDTILSSTDKVDDCEFNVIEIQSDKHILEDGDILPIEEYVKYVVLNYQHKFPDTELSKKLGISRKSLWEKRKKYGIVKKK